MTADDKAIIEACDELEATLNAQLEWVRRLRDSITPEQEELVVAPWH